MLGQRASLVSNPLLLLHDSQGLRASEAPYCLSSILVLLPRSVNYNILGTFTQTLRAITPAFGRLAAVEAHPEDKYRAGVDASGEGAKKSLLRRRRTHHRSILANDQTCEFGIQGMFDSWCGSSGWRWYG
ncbi:hypothetical protein BDR03DRAFT_969209 [Suillus americanus]|nr:hypothetical protein BDR03DRAFT_969209 [Suillus americanus]